MEADTMRPRNRTVSYAGQKPNTQGGTTQSRPRVVAGLALASVFWLLPGAAGADDTAIERGRVVAQQWCSVCHAETAAQTGENMELSFEELANRPLNNADRLRALMDENHFPMTTFRLFDHEKDDVVTYLVSLRQE